MVKENKTKGEQWEGKRMGEENNGGEKQTAWEQENNAREEQCERGTMRERNNAREEQIQRGTITERNNAEKNNAREDQFEGSTMREKRSERR